MNVQLTTLKETILNILTRSGYTEPEAATIMEVLLYAQLRGNNQGIVKLIGAGMPKSPNAGSMRLIKDTKLSALIDGAQNAGMVALQYAMELAISKATEHGIAIVGTNNTNTSTGAIGYYAKMAADKGLIGLVFSGSGNFVAFHGSYEPIFGTNPMAYAFPVAGGSPLVFDMATAAIARYGLIEAKTAGRTIPNDVAYDDQGQATDDPGAALAGATRTFAGYKGAALALMIELLTGQLVGTGHQVDGKKQDWGNLVVVIDPDALIGRDEFARNVAALVEQLQNAKRLPGVESILLPGQRGNQIMTQAESSGAIEIEDNLWAALQAQA